MLDPPEVARRRIHLLSSGRLHEAAMRLSAAAFKTHPRDAGVAADAIRAAAAMKRTRDAYAAVRSFDII